MLTDLAEGADHGEEKLAIRGGDDEVGEEAQDVTSIATEDPHLHSSRLEHAVQDHLLLARARQAASPGRHCPVAVEGGGLLKEEEEGALSCRDDLARRVPQACENEVKRRLLQLQGCLATFPCRHHPDASPVDRGEEGEHADRDPPVVVGERMRANLEEEDENSERQEREARIQARDQQYFPHPLDRVLLDALNALTAHLFQPQYQPDL
mmetsp:Transcript_46613/g.146143  ORF Transcript_46613/g.146143 Transcript_46613/m.146143 type:complete len:209 (-) Transcript_46613:1317-1943(-)